MIESKAIVAYQYDDKQIELGESSAFWVELELAWPIRVTPCKGVRKLPDIFFRNRVIFAPIS